MHNMKTNIFRGLGVAVVTPFLNDGTIDFYALRRIIEHVLQEGAADFLCVLGTTAETPTLTREEREMVMETFVDAVAGRVPLLLGCGGNNTQEVCRYLQEADLDGFDGVLVVAPYYNKPNQEGLFQHFVAVADASPLPVVLYNVPGRTGTNISAETTIRIAEECDNVVAIKEASGMLPQIDAIIAGAPDGFEVISGDDALTYSLIGLGAVGVISVVAGALPQDMGGLVHSALEGNYDAALDAHRRLREVFRLSFADGNPAGVKAMMAHLDLCQNVLRLPLVPVTEATEAAIAEALERIGDL